MTDQNQLLREIINAYLAADSDALFSAIRIADAILDAQPTEHEKAAAPLVPAPAHTCWGKAEKHLINSCTAYYTHEQLIAYAKQYAAWHGSLTTPPASPSQAQQPSTQAWANETGLRQIECPSCGDLAVAYDPQQAAETAARRETQEQLYAARERHTAEVKKLQAEIGRLQALRPVAMTEERIVQAQEEQGAMSILSFMKGVRYAEAHHNITQKEQG